MLDPLSHVDDTQVLGFANLSDWLFRTMNMTTVEASTLIRSASRQIRSQAYCEGKRGGLLRGYVLDEAADPADGIFPEWGAVLMAPAMAICGLHMLRFWSTNESPYHKLIASLFVVNSIGSFAVHSTGIAAWQHLDGNSMILTIWLVAVYLIEEFWGAALRDYCENWRKHGREGPPLPEAKRRWRSWKTRIMSLVWVTSLFLVFWLNDTNFMLNGVELGWGFDIGLVMFIAPLFLLLSLGGVMQWWGLVGPNVYVDERNTRMAMRRFRTGAATALFGMVLWLASEVGCEAAAFFAWLPGHAIFHVLAAVGLTNALIFATVLRADDARMHAEISALPPEAECMRRFTNARPPDTPCAEWLPRVLSWLVLGYFTVLPRITFTPLAPTGASAPSYAEEDPPPTAADEPGDSTPLAHETSSGCAAVASSSRSGSGLKARVSPTL